MTWGTSISDSTPPSDSAKREQPRAGGDVGGTGVAEADHAAESRPADVGDLGDATQELDDRGGAAGVRVHPQVQGAQTAVDEEAVERPGDGADRVLDEPQRSYISWSRVTTTPPTTSEWPPRYLVVECTTKSAPELERALVGRGGEGVVDRDQRSGSAGHDRRDVDHVEQRVGRALDPDQPRELPQRPRPAPPGRSDRRGRIARPQRVSTLSTSR